MLTLGVSGAVCDFGVVSIGTTALAMLAGIILNLILKDQVTPIRGQRLKIQPIDDYCDIPPETIAKLTK